MAFFLGTLLASSSLALGAGEDGKGSAVEAEGLSLLELLQKGGPVMIPLGLCSLIALAIGLERFFSLSRKKLVPPDFLHGLKSAWDGKVSNIGDGVYYCEANPSPTARMFKPGITGLVRGETAAEKAIEDAGVREADRLHRSLRSLSVIAAVSPLLGLLGTVYGLIGAFQDANAQDIGKGQELAKGIYEALVTTAAGLTIAIPVLLAYQYLRTRTDRSIDEMSILAEEFAEHYLMGNHQMEEAA